MVIRMTKSKSPYIYTTLHGYILNYLSITISESYEPQLFMEQELLESPEIHTLDDSEFI